MVRDTTEHKPVSKEECDSWTPNETVPCATLYSACGYRGEEVEYCGASDNTKSLGIPWQV